MHLVKNDCVTQTPVTPKFMQFSRIKSKVKPKHINLLRLTDQK